MSQPAQAPARLLIVEDDPVYERILRAHLGRLGDRVGEIDHAGRVEDGQVLRRELEALGRHEAEATALESGQGLRQGVDGPAVLGWHEWRRIDAQNGVRELRKGLEELMNSGVLKRLPLDALSYMLSGAMNEAALWLAEQKQEAKSLADAQAVLDRFLDSLMA